MNIKIKFILLCVCLILTCIVARCHGQTTDTNSVEVNISGTYQERAIVINEVIAISDPNWKNAVMLNFKGVKMLSDEKTEEISFQMYVQQEMNMQGQVHVLELNKEIHLPSVNIGFVAMKLQNDFAFNLGSQPNTFTVTRFSQHPGDVVEGQLDIKLACPTEDCGWLKGTFSCVVER